MIAREAYSSQVHDTELFVQNLIIGQLGILCRIRIDTRIVRINTIDLRRLQNDVRIDFDTTQTGGRISREEGITGTS